MSVNSCSRVALLKAEANSVRICKSAHILHCTESVRLDLRGVHTINTVDDDYCGPPW